MKSAHALSYCANDRSEIRWTRQSDINQRLLIRVKHALHALHTRRGRGAIESKAVACGWRSSRVAQTAAEAVGGKELARVVALEYVADGCNCSLIPAPCI
jgi:hypothetical protein